MNCKALMIHTLWSTIKPIILYMELLLRHLNLRAFTETDFTFSVADTFEMKFNKKGVLILVVVIYR